MSHYEDLNTTKIALVGFISTVIVFALILLMMVLFHWEMAELNQERMKEDSQRFIEFDTLTSAQREKMADFRWIDREKKIVQIPIKDAIRITLEELQKQQAEKSSPDVPSANAPKGREGDHGP
jgi:hypothetical protein